MLNHVKNIRLMAIGAHPDDCESKVGGIAVNIIKNGGKVMFVSATNGNAGHHEMTRDALKERRSKEADKVAEEFGIEYNIMDNEDGSLQNTLTNRDYLIGLIRSFRPDVIVTHRTNDYHTDHRNTGLLVQDASFLLRVPLVCPGTPALEYDPVILYMGDGFKKPNRIQPDAVVDVEEHLDAKAKMLYHHESQFFEWLPWLAGNLDCVPKDLQGRLEWCRQWLLARSKNLITPQISGAYRMIYGSKAKDTLKCVEIFEISEYGADISPEELWELLGIKE